MRKFNKILLAVFALFLLMTDAFSQRTEFSIATDIGVLRSFKKGQRFFTFGHTIQAQFHFTSRDAMYVWVSYYLDGKFENNLTATAKLPATVPQEIAYTNKASMRLRQVSVGWKKYLTGAYNNETTNSIYGYAGFGLLVGEATNNVSSVDSALYYLPVEIGEGAFKRLTLDLGLGCEIPIGNALFLYGEARAWLPTTDFPSKYLFVNDDAPICGMLNFGIRILFD